MNSSSVCSIKALLLALFMYWCNIREILGRTVPKECFVSTVRFTFQSTINVLTEEGAYIEPVQGSMVKIAALNKPFVNGHIVSFEMNMTSADGVVFYLFGHGKGKSEFLALEVANGYFRYHIKCGYLDALLTITDIKANDRKWHTVQFFRRSARGNLKIDGRRYFHHYPVHCRGLQSLVLGGVSPDHRHVVSAIKADGVHFEGCIRKLDISTGWFSPPYYKGVSQCT